MKKLFPILIGLGLTGFSAMSQAENLLQVYQQARISNPDLRKSAADRDAAFEKSTKRVAHYCRNSVWARIIPIPAGSVITKTRTPTSPAVHCS